ncbi:MAG TPA: GNAT family N-acetyltransferase [Puia sp.]|nr:GNAT family N-acetyltransferase [Puia sp.]
MSITTDPNTHTETPELKPIGSQSEIDSTVAFLQSTISHPMTKEIWEWEFNTFKDSTVLTILKDQDGTAGTQFMLPVKLNFRNQEILSGKCENSYFHDKYRGKGLFEKLFQTAVDDAIGKSMKLLWAFTPATKVYEKKLGYTVFQDSMFTFSSFFGRPDMGYFKKFSANKVKRLLKYLYYSLKFTSFGFRYRSFRAKANYDEYVKKYTIQDSLGRPEDMTSLYAGLRAQYKDLIHLNMNKDYMDWRVSGNVNLSYITKYFYRNGELAGYYIMTAKEFSVNLSDFTYVSPETAGVMLCHLVEEVLKLRVMEFNYFANIENGLNQQTFNLLRQLGGQLTKTTSMPFVFRLYSDLSSAPDTSFFDLPQNWYLNGLWTEGFNY